MPIQIMYVIRSENDEKKHAQRHRIFVLTNPKENPNNVFSYERIEVIKSTRKTLFRVCM